MDKPTARKIFLSQQFTQETAKLVISTILDINDKDDLIENELKTTYGATYERKPILIYIDSYGGTCYQAFGIISVVEASKTPVHTIVTGCAMSCGFLLLISGHKRFAYQHSTVLYHQVSSGAIGTLKELEDNVEEAKRLNKKLQKLTLDKTSITKSRLKEVNDKKIDWYMDAQEALKLKIVDEII